MAVEHGARLLGLMLQIDGNEVPANLGLDAQAAIHKAKTAGQPD
jgi:hypothetical protein